MKQIITITINFQSASVGQRPTDGSLNRESIATDNMGNIPLVGDYVCFDNEDEIKVVYKVKSRLFDYKYEDETNNWTVYANIVVEKQHEDTYNKLIKL